MQETPVTKATNETTISDKHPLGRVDILLEEANNWQWPWILTPLFLWQFCRYLYAIGVFFSSPEFPLLDTPITGHDGVTYHYANHLLNTAVVHSSPSRYLSGAHLFMAASWLAGLLMQRQFIVWMSRAATSNNWSLYNRWKIMHRYLGIGLCLTCIIGSVAGSLMAFSHHQSAFMWVVYVIILPSLFLPWLILIWHSGRQARNSIEGLQRHRFWVKWGFVAPAFTSTFSLTLIRILNQPHVLGPHVGEIVAIVFSFLTSFFLLKRYIK